MAAVLEPMIDTNIRVITNDGRVFVGCLKGFDQTVNIVMENTHERVRFHLAYIKLPLMYAKSFESNLNCSLNYYFSEMSCSE